VSELASEPSPLTPRALWIPFEVKDLDAATRFYTDHIGLSVVDSWDRDGERGVVLRVADGAFIELVEPGVGHPTLLAFEQADESEVDAVYQRVGEDNPPPQRYPRGHYGFAVDGPGVRVMVWSEK
jgi:catechol 2,3-dioxygenase-like lactoylglutathione lyase family enzyme